MRKKWFTSFSLVTCAVFIWAVQVQGQVTIDKDGDMQVENGLKGSFPGSAIVIDGDGYLNIETGLRGKAAPVERTGQTDCYKSEGLNSGTIPCDNTGQDGDLQMGAAWPGPRFTDNGDGTVTDHLTGLIRLKNANCFGKKIWATALADCNSLASGSCGLSDNSLAGDWRLPSIKELQSLIDFAYVDPALSDAAGTGQVDLRQRLFKCSAGRVLVKYHVHKCDHRQDLHNLGLDPVLR